MRRYEMLVIFPLEEDQHAAGREQLLNDLAKNGDSHRFNLPPRRAPCHS